MHAHWLFNAYICHWTFAFWLKQLLPSRVAFVSLLVAIASASLSDSLLSLTFYSQNCAREIYIFMFMVGFYVGLPPVRSSIVIKANVRLTTRYYGFYACKCHRRRRGRCCVLPPVSYCRWCCVKKWPLTPICSCKRTIFHALAKVLLLLLLPMHEHYHRAHSNTNEAPTNTREKYRPTNSPS